MSGFETIKQGVGDYYGRKLREHGATPAGVDWNSDASQRLRFRQLMRIAEDAGHYSINDYGCGYGALTEYLDESARRYDYCGYDLSPAMLESARERLARAPGSGERRLVGEVRALPVADYTVASGIFNVLAGASPNDWLHYVRATIMDIAQVSRRGLAFNCLTSYSDPARMRADLYYADPCAMFDWCKRSVSSQVAVLHDYGLYEFTVLVRLGGDGR